MNWIQDSPCILSFVNFFYFYLYLNCQPQSLEQIYNFKLLLWISGNIIPRFLNCKVEYWTIGFYMTWDERNLDYLQWFSIFNKFSPSFQWKLESRCFAGVQCLVTWWSPECASSERRRNQHMEYITIMYICISQTTTIVLKWYKAGKRLIYNNEPIWTILSGP